MAFVSWLDGPRLRTARFLLKLSVDPEQAEFVSDFIAFFDEDLGGTVIADNPGALTRSVYRRFVTSQP